MGFDLWSDDQVVRDYIYQPTRSSPATGQTHEYKALINLWPGAGGGVAGVGGAGGPGGGGPGGGGATGGVEGEGSFRKGAGDVELSGMKIKWLDLECGLSRNSSCG